MKPSYYIYVAIAVVAILVGFLLGRGQTGNVQPSDAVPQASGSPDASNPQAGQPASRASAKLPSGAVIHTGVPMMLPEYYSQQLASSTLEIHLVNPISGSQVASPLSVTGEARGSWYFEATFPIFLTDWDGRILAQGHAIAQKDWMTTDFVPFAAALNFPQQKSGSRGFLILKKDNPSGLAKNDSSVEIAVYFK